MNDSITKYAFQTNRKRPSAKRLALAIALAGFSLTVQAGKIISVPSASGADGFGGWNLGNVDVVLSGTLSTFDPLTGDYSFDLTDTDFTYIADVFDDIGTTQGHALAKDWPVGEPAGIKIVNDDFDVKEGKPTNCIMSTSYLADHFLDSANPVQVPCSGPFQSHKRYKLAMLPTSIDGVGEEGIDLVFNVEADGTSRDYQVFQKINNWTEARLEGFTVQVGTGLGANFIPAATDITGVGVTNLSLSVPSTVWNAKQLANFSSGLFGPVDTSHGRPAGYFDPIDPAGFFIDEYGVGSVGDASGQIDTLTATTTLGSDYADIPPGTAALAPAANQFGPWLPDNMLPYGIFWDNDNNPETDAELIAWYGWDESLVVPGLGWMSGAEGGFASIPDADIDTNGANLTYTMGLIDDLVNVGLNYVVTVGDVTGFPGYNADPALNTATFTIRVTPTKDASGTLAPAYTGLLPIPSLEFKSSDAVVSLDPSPEFIPGSLLTVRVGDADLNGDTGAIEFTTVEVTSDGTPAGPVTLTLEEQGENRGVFAATLPEEFSNVALGTTVTVTYEDVAGSSGGANDFKPVSSIAVAVLGAGTIQFNPLNYTVAENDGSILVTVDRSAGFIPGADVTVEYLTVSGTAIGGEDYVANTGQLIFTGADASKTIEIVLVNDSVVEADKSFTVLLTNVNGGPTLSDVPGEDTATITITDSDVVVLTSSSSGSSCSYNPDGSVDPLLPGLVLASLIYLGWRTKRSDIQ